MKKFVKIFGLSFLAFSILLCSYFRLVSSPNNLNLVRADESTKYELNSNLGEDFFIQNAQNEFLTLEQNQYLDLPYFTKQQFIVDVVLVNYEDFAYFTPDKYIETFDRFDKVSEYYRIFSRNKLNIKFNISVGTLLDFNYADVASCHKLAGVAQSIHLLVKKNCICLKSYGEADAKCVFLSARFLPHDSILWPVTYLYNDPLMEPITCMGHLIEDATLVHEVGHCLGLYDLYNCSGNLLDYMFSSDYISPVKNSDIMSTGYNFKTPTSAYNRQCLGWLTESNNSDNISTEIEYLDKTGNYTLQTCDSQNGTLAYKFGTKNNEFFLIEQRYVNDKSYLVVQKINTNYRTNLNAKNNSELFIYSLRNSNGEIFFKQSDTLGVGNNKLKYADNTEATYFINNIKVWDNGQITFSFYTSISNIHQEDTNTEQDDTQLTEVEKINKDNRDIFVLTVDENQNFLKLTKIEYYNAGWRETNNVSIVYVANQKVYAIFNLSPFVTDIKLTYESYGVSESKIININKNQDQYYAQINRNIIQQTGEAFENIKNNIFEYFNKFLNIFNKNK